jgi:hypothetical protein
VLFANIRNYCDWHLIHLSSIYAETI